MKSIFITLTLLSLISCKGQTRVNSKNPENKTNNSSQRVGVECEAGYCYLIYTGIPKEINSIDTSAGWFEKGQKLVVTGTVFQIDGKTPAPNVIVYYHHTDDNGYYS